MTETPIEIPSFKTEIEWFKLSNKLPELEKIILIIDIDGDFYKASLKELKITEGENFCLYSEQTGYSLLEYVKYWAYFPEIEE